jgi:ribosomal protein S18 acetylase RimI-like enzyme
VYIVVREFRSGDGEAIARISRENTAYYSRLAPEYFKEPDQEGFVEYIESDGDWRASPDNLSLVAEVDGQVAGYLEASLQPPHETARWQGQRDLAVPRLFINYVGTADEFKRQGVATRLVEEAEAWGRAKGAVVALCDTYIDSDLSVPFWEQRMGYKRRSIRLRKPL